MKHVWKMLMAAVLCLTMLLPLVGTTETAAEQVWGVCTGNEVRIRKQPSTNANMWFYMDEGFVAEILDEIENSDGTVAWYKISLHRLYPWGLFPSLDGEGDGGLPRG